MDERENLPVHVEEDETGSISYANDVIAIIAGMAATEVDGVSSMGATAARTDRMTKGKAAMRGVRVEVSDEETSVDLQMIVDYGKPIQKVCTDVQENVRKAIETMTGLKVIGVDIHVVGISFEKENKEIANAVASTQSAAVRPAAPQQNDGAAPKAAADPDRQGDPVETDDDDGTEIGEGE